MIHYGPTGLGFVYYLTQAYRDTHDFSEIRFKLCDTQ
jgi:hypothetical protein